MMLGKLQSEIRDWTMYNFPDTDPVQQYMGIVEELGELSHALLKEEQGIRHPKEGTWEDDMRDAVGDIAIYMINFCDQCGWDFEKILATTWEKVAGRDWRNNPKTGAAE